MCGGKAKLEKIHLLVIKETDQFQLFLKKIQEEKLH